MSQVHTIQLLLEHTAGPCRDLRLQWCASAGRILVDHDIDHRLAPDGLVLRMGKDSVAEDAALPQTLRLYAYPTIAEIFRSTCDLPAGMGELLHVRCGLGKGLVSKKTCRIESLPPLVGAMPIRLRPGCVPCMALDLETTSGELCEASLRSAWSERTMLHLAAPRMRWKYLIGGDLAECDPQIVDLSVDPSQRLAFVRRDSNRTPGGVEFLSDREITLRRESDLRLQLRSRKDDRILLRRLPHAAPGDLGREILEDGRVITVAHVFVNP